MQLTTISIRVGPRTNGKHADRLMIGVGRANAPPPSEPDWQFSSVRLSS
jgi:hypothetical protein